MDAAAASARLSRLTSVADWKREQGAVPEPDREIVASLSRVERFAVWVTDHVGSLGFFGIIAIWTAVWLAWNTWGPTELRFDPGPSFLMWLFISNVIQLHLMPLIMVGQNLQDHYAELRAEADYRVSLKAEAEVEAVLRHLSAQNEVLIEILRRLERLDGQRA